VAVLEDVGEFGLIERLRAALPRVADARMLLGIGDDAAVWRAPSGYAIATTDTMVAGVHFLPGRVAWRDVGWKAMAANVSDIAAMGGTPGFALVTLCVPSDTAIETVEALYGGLGECAEAYGVAVAGGDIVASPVVTITIALYGEPAVSADGSPMLLRRDAALAGDVIAVSGVLGGSAGGLRVLLDAAVPRDVARQRLVERHMRPQPRIDAGRAAVDAGVRSAIDISDGLLQDLGHICDASDVSADVSLAQVPLDPDLVGAYPDDATSLALSGGEDYELLLIGTSDAIAGVHSRVPVIVIGEIVDRRSGGDAVRCLDDAGNEVRFASTGWDHLKGTRH
jgi:thiamine-monophosphate kinase